MPVYTSDENRLLYLTWMVGSWTAQERITGSELPTQRLAHSKIRDLWRTVRVHILDQYDNLIQASPTGVEPLEAIARTGS